MNRFEKTDITVDKYFSILDSSLLTQYDLKQVAKYDILLPEDIKAKAEILQKIMILLVTANPVETSATHSYLKPLNDHDYVYKFNQGVQQGSDVIYYIGQYGACPAAIRGDSEVCSSIKTLSMMADQCFPNLGGIISVGIVHGIKDKVQIYDVLVSEKVINYDKAENKDEGYLQKGKPIIVSSELFKLFTQRDEWPDVRNKKYLNDHGNLIPNVKSGVLLSGPCTVDNPATEKILSRDFANEAIGIEMDRAYFYTESQYITPNTIIVKAVSNFENEKNDEVYELIASLLAADLVHKCLSDPQAPEIFKVLFNVFVNVTTYSSRCAYIISTNKIECMCVCMYIQYTYIGIIYTYM